MENKKHLFLIRHGEGKHNVDWYTYGEEAYYIKEFTDPKLTPTGIKQASDLNKNFVEINNIQLVVTSSLTRCLQTTQHVFNGVQVPIIVHEYAREFPMGLQYSNKRRVKSVLEKEFANYDFSNVKSEEDELWNSKNHETEEELKNRTKKLVEYLSKRPEKNIAVVAHSTFIMNLLYDTIDESHDMELKHCHPYDKFIENIDSETHKASSF